MNNFLFLFGSQLPEIRRLLNWTQDDVASKTGISRATIVGFEKDPSKLHKYFALAIFSFIVYEVTIRRQKLKSINFSSPNLREQLDKLGFAPKLVSAIFPSVIAGIIGMGGAAIGSAIANRSTFGFVPRFFSKTSDTSDVDAEKLKQYVESSIQYTEEKLIESLGLEKLDITYFVKLLEQSEDH